MDVRKAIEDRRAYRSLDPIAITDDLVNDLASSAILAPSCFNKQPERFVFVYDKDTLEKMHGALPKANAWATTASMLIAVFSERDSDCIIKDREYYLFDTGMATAFLILRATELGLVAHPMGGYNEKRIKEVLGIPENMTVITLVGVGKKSDDMNPVLTDQQIAIEKERPERLPLEEFSFKNRYKTIP
jgi:nitroreductase